MHAWPGPRWSGQRTRARDGGHHLRGSLPDVRETATASGLSRRRRTSPSAIRKRKLIFGLRQGFGLRRAALAAFAIIVVGSCDRPSREPGTPPPWIPPCGAGPGLDTRSVQTHSFAGLPIPDAIFVSSTGGTVVDWAITNSAGVASLDVRSGFDLTAYISARSYDVGFTRVVASTAGLITFPLPAQVDAPRRPGGTVLIDVTPLDAEDHFTFRTACDLETRDAPLGTPVEFAIDERCIDDRGRTSVEVFGSSSDWELLSHGAIFDIVVDSMDVADVILSGPETIPVSVRFPGTITDVWSGGIQFERQDEDLGAAFLDNWDIAGSYLYAEFEAFGRQHADALEGYVSLTLMTDGNPRSTRASLRQLDTSSIDRNLSTQRLPFLSDVVYETTGSMPSFSWNADGVDWTGGRVLWTGNDNFVAWISLPPAGTNRAQLPPVPECLRPFREPAAGTGYFASASARRTLESSPPASPELPLYWTYGCFIGCSETIFPEPTADEYVAWTGARSAGSSLDGVPRPLE